MKLSRIYMHRWVFVFVLFIFCPVFAGQIRINEIYYDPPGLASEEVDSEFIELYVIEGGFDPSGWYVLDWDDDHKKWVIPESCPQVRSGDYIVIHLGKGVDYDSSAARHFYIGETSSKLSNSGDPVGLRDDKDVPQDFVSYEGGTDSELSSSDFCSWPNDGKNPLDCGLRADSGFSLQFSENWIAAEPTCGYQNVRVEIISKPSEIMQVSVTPQPFILGSSGDLKISFTLSYGANVAIRIYDVRGRLNVSLKEGEYFAGGENYVVWDGKNGKGRESKIGIYILYIEVKSGQGVSSLKKTIVAGK